MDTNSYFNVRLRQMPSQYYTCVAATPLVADISNMCPSAIHKGRRMIEISEQVLDQKVPSAMAVVWAAQRITSVDGLIIAAGAGMGVDSGMPDFRGNAGFWKAYPALARKSIAFMDVSAPTTFYDEPRRAWGLYGHRLELYRNTVPHLGYHLLRQWATAMRQGYLGPVDI